MHTTPLPLHPGISCVRPTSAFSVPVLNAATRMSWPMVLRAAPIMAIVKHTSKMAARASGRWQGRSCSKEQVGVKDTCQDPHAYVLRSSTQRISMPSIHSGVGQGPRMQRWPGAVRASEASPICPSTAECNSSAVACRHHSTHSGGGLGPGAPRWRRGGGAGRG